jgi:hypothetical protein
MKKVLLGAILLLNALLSDAQVSFSLTGGAYKVSVSPDFLTYPDTTIKSFREKITPEIGLMINLPISKTLSVATGVLYNRRATDYNQFYDTANLYNRVKNLPDDKRYLILSSNTVMNIGYIDLPLYLKFAFPIKQNSIFIGGGPHLAMFLNNNLNYKTIRVSQAFPDVPSEAEFRDEKVLDYLVGNGPNHYKGAHISMSAFAGVSLGKISLTARYNTDLTEFYKDDTRKFKFTTVGVSLSYLIVKDLASAASKR